jgi:signal transduction histidine kinase
MFFYSLNWIAMFHFTLLFPEPTELAKRRWFVLGIYLVPQSILLIGNGIQFVRSENTLDWMASGFWGQGVHASIFLFAALIGVIWQAFRTSNSKSRQQIRWLLLSSIVMGLAVFSLYILPGVLGLETISPNMLGLIITPFPIALGVAILRHNLFDIDTLFNRALVYGALTLGTMTLYMLVVGVASTSLGIDNRSLVAFLTTGVVAVIFQPLRDRLQSWVNRWMYGYRDDPYQALSHLGNTLAKTFGSKDALPNILATVSETLKLPYVAIRLPGEATISHGQLSSEADIEMFPLNYQGQSFGQLEVVPRSADEPFRPSELKLLQDLSRQIENAIHNLLLAEELQRSRQQLVTAREEERRRIRRDLHDGLGPLLASQAMTLEAIEEILEGDREQALQLIQEMKDQSRDAIVDIRRLVYDLRPPELDNLGLTEALRQKFSHVSDEQLAIVFNAPVPTQVLPAAVEIAAYRIASEAITNVIRHADATHCIVLIRVEGDTFELHVSDNGNGLPDQVKSGVGLSSIHERAEEIGGQVRIEQAKEGGLHILAELPLK